MRMAYQMLKFEMQCGIEPTAVYRNTCILGYVERDKTQRYYPSFKQAVEAIKDMGGGGVTLEPDSGWTLRVGDKLFPSTSGEKSWLVSSPTFSEFSPVITNAFLRAYVEEPLVYHKTFEEAANAMT